MNVVSGRKPPVLTMAFDKRYKNYVNDNDVQILTIKNPRVALQLGTAAPDLTEVENYKTYLITDVGEGRARLKVQYVGINVSATVYDVGLIGYGVKRLSGSQGIIHDAFVNYQAILKEGSRSFELGNNYIVTSDHVNKLADFWKKFLFKKKHRYQVTFTGRRYWYELGDWYTLQIGGAGQEEYIDSTVMCTNVTFEVGEDDLGLTVVTFLEVEENWKFDSNALARTIASGSPKAQINRGNIKTVAPFNNVTTADYYLTGVSDQTILNSGIDYLNGNLGGTEQILAGTIYVDDTIIPKTNISIECKGSQIVADTGANTVVEVESAASNVEIVNAKIQNTTTTAYDKYLIDLNGATNSKIVGGVLNYTKCAGILNDGNNNSILNNQMSGGKSNTITAGTAYEFNNAQVSSLGIAWLTASTFVVAYRDHGNSNRGTARIGVVSAGVVTYGDEYVFNAATTIYIKIARITDTSFVIAYRDAGNSEYGTAIIGVVSNGDDIAYGSEYIFNAASVTYPWLSILASNSFAVVYRDAGNSFYGTAIIGVIANDDEITFGAEYVFNSADSRYISCSRMTDSKFIVAYADNVAGTGEAVIGTVTNDDEVAYGTVHTFNTNAIVFTTITRLTDTVACLAYGEGLEASSIGKIQRIDISSSDITSGRKYIYNTDVSEHTAIRRYNDNSFILVYRDNNNSSYGTAITGIVLGNHISLSTPYVFTSSATDSMTVDILSPDGIIGFYDGVSAGDAIILSADINQCIGIISSGNNAIIQSNHITADDTEIQEVGIYVSGSESIVVNNVIDGLTGSDRNIKVGILIASTANRTIINSTKVLNCLNYGIVNYGTNTKLNNCSCYNNGDDTGFANENQHNFLDLGIGTQKG